MTGRPATRTRGFGTRLVSGSSRVPFPARGTMTFMSHPSVAVFEPHHIVDFGSRGLEQVGRHHRLELVDHLGLDVERGSLRHGPLDQRIALLDAQDDLAREHVNRFVLLVVVLQRQDVSGLDVEDLADVAVGSGPDQLVAPGLFDAIRQLAHAPSPRQNAECGVRNAEWHGPGRAALPATGHEPGTLNSAFRIPNSALPSHSAFGHTFPGRLSLKDDGEVTHAVTHTPHPTQPSGRSTGCPPASIARARSPTGHARAHTPQLTPWKVMQRPGSSSRTPMWISSHPPVGGTRAPVAQACAQGMSAHTTHAWIAGSMIGVPAARPAPGGALMIACTGHTGMQSPQRVHEARKAISSAAPGGRK